MAARAGGLPEGYRPGDPLVLFRRIPGTYQYADPNTGEIKSDYFVKNYRKSRTEGEREIIRLEARASGRTGPTGKTITARNYLARERASRSSFNQEEYNELIARRSLQKAELDSAREERMVVGRGRYEDLKGPNSELAQTLVDLGLRLPGDTFDVGDSPDNYAQTVYEAYQEMFEEL